MIDVSQIRERAALGGPAEVTMVNLAFLRQVADELDAGRAAQAELAQLRAREGMIFARPPR